MQPAPISIRIRHETAEDTQAIGEVTACAFQHAPHTSHTEQHIVSGLRRAGKLAISLVAEADGTVVGHVAISPVSISSGASGWFGLGPVSVLPQHQGRGIGSQLIREALRLLRGSGASGCVVLGEPRYYGRFGFQADPTWSCRVTHRSTSRPFASTHPCLRVPSHTTRLSTLRLDGARSGSSGPSCQPRGAPGRRQAPPPRSIRHGRRSQPSGVSPRGRNKTHCRLAPVSGATGCSASRRLPAARAGRSAELPRVPKSLGSWELPVSTCQTTRTRHGGLHCFKSVARSAVHPARHDATDSSHELTGDRERA